MLRLLLLVLALALPAAQAPASDYITMKSGGKERQYILVTPTVTAAGPVPLVVVLHGTMGTGSKMQRGLGFDPYADTYGVAFAYPDAYIEPGESKTTRWNDGRDTLASSKLDIDDSAFLRDMVNDIAGRIPLDRTRVFVTGASNGGMMAYRAACEAADVFAGSAPVIGNIPVPLAPHCKPSRPIAILNINGTDDPFVPFAGGEVCKGVRDRFCEHGQVISAEQSLAHFARAAGCAATPSRIMLPAKVQGDPPVQHVSYPGCKGGVLVEAFWIQGGGHTWPPKKGQLLGKNGEPTRNLDATQEILRFFLGR